MGLFFQKAFSQLSFLEVKNFCSAINVNSYLQKLMSCPEQARRMYIVSTDLQCTKIDLALMGRIRMMLDLLPRKEVIHPHLPVRIPCYDLTPIISPTLGLGKLGRQVLATFMV